MIFNCIFAVIFLRRFPLKNDFFKYNKTRTDYDISAKLVDIKNERLYLRT